MVRADEITKILKDIVDPIQKLNVLLQSDRVHYEMVRGDYESLLALKGKLLEENAVIESQNQKSREMSSKITDMAKEEAKQTLDGASKKLADAIVLLESVKSFVSEVDKKRYQELNGKVAVLIGKK